MEHSGKELHEDPSSEQILDDSLQNLADSYGKFVSSLETVQNHFFLQLNMNREGDLTYFHSSYFHL